MRFFGYKPRRLPLLSLFFTVSLVVAQTTDAAGKWSGVIAIEDPAAGNTMETPVQLDLEQKNGSLSGKIGRTGDPERVEIRNGKLEGDAMTFEASFMELSASMKFFLTLQGDRLTGEMKGSAAGNEIVAKVRLSRVK